MLNWEDFGAKEGPCRLLAETICALPTSYNWEHFSGSQLGFVLQVRFSVLRRNMKTTKEDVFGRRTTILNPTESADTTGSDWLFLCPPEVTAIGQD
jgi:hypothetical protein